MCTEQHIVHRVIPFVLWLDRQGQLLGAPLPVLEEAKQRAQDCLRFELEFRSDGVATDDGIEIASSVTATATIVFDPDSLAFTRTTAPLRNTLYTMGPLDGCSGEFESADVEFQVLGLQLIPSAFDLAAPADRAPQIGEVVDVELLMMTAPTQEIATFTCFGMTMPMGPFPLWSGMFGFTHQDEIVLADGSTPPPVSGPSGDLMEGMFGGSGMGTGTIPADSGFLLGGWEVVGGELFATRTWTRAADTIVESGTMDLRHTPQ